MFLKMVEEILSVVVPDSLTIKTPLLRYPLLLTSLLSGWLGWTACELSALTINELRKATETSRFKLEHILFIVSIKKDESFKSN